MIPVLAKVLIGVTIVALGVAVYKVVNKDNLAETIEDALEEAEADIFADVVKAKVKKIEREKGTITLGMLNNLDKEVGICTLNGCDEIQEDIYLGLVVEF